jgi:hypothetical protein
MPGGFAPRFAIEAGFLILLGVGAGIADLRTQVIVLLVAGGWVLVSLIELSIWRAEGRTARGGVPAPPVEPELEVGWPAVEPVVEEDEPYPLRSDADVRDEDAEEYTRVIAATEPTEADEKESGTG